MCSLNLLFTSDKREYASAYQLIKNYKVPGDMSEFEAIIELAAQYGLEKAEVRRQLDIHVNYIHVNSFCKKEVNMLQYVGEAQWFQISKLKNLPDNAGNLLKTYTEMPNERLEKIVQTIRQKIEYLELFLEGIKRIFAIRFSPDLLQGKRPEVFHAAAGYYYEQAKEIAEGIKIAEILRKRANRTQRELK